MVLPRWSQHFRPSRSRTGAGIEMATLCNPPPTWFHPRSGPPILPRRCHRRPEHSHESHHRRPEVLPFNPMIRRIQQQGNRCEFPARMGRERVLRVKPPVRQGPLETRRAAQRVSENNLPVLPRNLALVNEGRTFAAAKAKVQPRPGICRGCGFWAWKQTNSQPIQAPPE